MARGQPELHEILLEIAEGAKVYFQPPTDIRMEYPCMVYERDAADTKHADNAPYRYTKRYQIKWIDRDPLSPIPDKIAALPSCTFDRFYTAADLNHDVFNIFF